MRTVQAILRGLMRMTECTGLVLAMWLITLVGAVPAALVMQAAIESDLGASLVEAELRGGLELGWLEEFHHRGGDIAEALTPVRVSRAMAFETADLWLTGTWLKERRGLVASAVLLIVVWILLQGGIITLLASPDLRFRWSTFLAAGGSFFGRFLRLALLVSVAYFGVYRFAIWLFPTIDRWTRDVTTETETLIWHSLGAILVAALLGWVHLVAEFAKIVTVREKRRSVVLALIRSGGLIFRHPVQVLGVFVFMNLMLWTVMGLYYWLAPAVDGAGPWSILGALAVGQIYLLFRWSLRIARYGAEIALVDSWIEAAWSAR